jgi:BRCA1-associated protein
MDETTGLLTILCQHVFHCACLEKWRNSGCPVCRYTQNDALTGRRHRGDDGEETEDECSVCGSTSNLWICLICNNIGCGRYDSAHAYAHWEATGHHFAMDITTHEVWDYAGDGYVHRLIQNKADGKLIDLPAAASRTGANANAGLTALGEDSVPREKIENMSMEYTYLLTSQLDSQRRYYEEKLDRAADKASQAASQVDEAVKSSTVMSSELSKAQGELKEAQAAIQNLSKDLTRQTNKATTSAELARKMTKQYQEEKTINESLMTKLKFLEDEHINMKKENEGLKNMVMELREELRDMQFFISGADKLKEMQSELGDEVTEGTVEVPVAKGGKRKGKAKKGASPLREH